MMPNSDLRDRFVYPNHKPMLDSYYLTLVVKHYVINMMLLAKMVTVKAEHF